MQRRNGNVQVQDNNNNYTWIKIAEIGEIFTLRIEYRENADGTFTYVYYANGINLFSKTVTADNKCDGRFQMNMREDGASSRNNVVTMSNFKYIKYVVTEKEETEEPVNPNPGTDPTPETNPYEPETPDFLASMNHRLW